MARRRAGLSQRELGQRTAVPQSTIARIESGFVDPRVSTVVKLLAACGDELEALPRLGDGVDRSNIRANLTLTPSERVTRAVVASRNVRRLKESIRWTSPSSTQDARSTH